VIANATSALRKKSLALLEQLVPPDSQVLLAGVGTGLDIPFLPPDRHYTGIDLTPAMLSRAKRRNQHSTIDLHIGDVMKLPYPDAYFDAIVMHLIVTVVGNPTKALLEAERVLKKQGKLIVLDKFLKPGQFAPLRRAINPVIRRIATQTSVTFEDHVRHCHQLKIISDEPVLAGGWFRRIVLTKS